MSKKFLIVILFLVALTFYLNRAYAYIYDSINRASLPSPDKAGTYTLGYSASPKELIYVALGDSLTAGVGVNQYEQSYPYLLAQKMLGNQEILNSSGEIILKDLAVPGFKTQDLINYSLTPTVELNPDVITLLIGVNDLHGQVSENDFRKNYQQILDTLTKKTAAKIYVIGLPPIGSNQLLLPPYNYYFRWQTKQFNQIIKDLANQYNLIYIDLATPTAVISKNNGPYYATDSFHPSAQGYEIWAKIIYDHLHQ